MHEVAIAESIVSLVEEAAAGRKVLSIAVEIGTDSCVSPDALAFCFELAAEGSAVAGAALEISRPAGDRLNVKHMELEEAA